MKIYLIRCRSPSKILRLYKHMFVFQEEVKLLWSRQNMEQVTSLLLKVGQTTYKVNVFFAENTTATLRIASASDGK